MDYHFTKNNEDGLDYAFLICTVILIFFGLLMDYSASFIFASDKFSDGYFFVKRHIVFLVIGFITMIVISSVNYQKIQKFVFHEPAWLLRLLGVKIE